MKKFTVFLLLSCAAICNLSAHDTATFIFNHDAIIIPFQGYTIPCMGYKDTVEVWLDNDFQPNTIGNWSASGELKIVEIFTGKRGVRIASTGAARGGLNLSYNRGTCGGASAGFIINKSFHPQDLELVIRGPECVITGQKVVYSVEPVLTKNLGAMIGIDSYYWNILNHDETPAFVDSVLYVSGDTSSVTFRVGDIDPLHLPVIEVMVGACNRLDTIRLELGNATPAPVFETDTLFVPYGTNPFKVRLVEPDPDITYTWECDYDHAASFRLDTIHGDSILVTPEKSAEADICTLTVTAVYNTITCNSTPSSIAIKRAWGDSIVVAAKYQDGSKKTDSCFHVGETYSFNVSGKIPASSHCEWILPHGWSFKNPDDAHKHTVDIIPSAGASLTDTLRVRPLDRRDTASAKLFAVHVQPARITAIIAPSCVDIGTTQTFSIDTTGIFPHAQSFYWEVDTAVTFTGQGTTSISFVPTQGTTAVSVTAKGQDGCDAETYTQTLNLPPQQPDSIISDNECLFSGYNDTVTLSIQTPIEGLTYAWNIPSGWEPVYNNKHDSVTFVAKGTQGYYPISAWAVGTGTCNNSPVKTYTLQIDTMDWSIGIVDYGPRVGLVVSLYKNQIEDYNIEGEWTLIGERHTEHLPSANYYTWTRGTYGDLQYVSVTISVDGCEITLEWSNETSQNNIPKRKDIANSNTHFIENIFPNPAKDHQINVKLIDDSLYNIKLFSSTGLLALRQNVQGSRIYNLNLQSLSSGTYYLIVSKGRDFETETIIIK